MRTLTLTSPPMTGEDVGRAQTILHGNNIFQQTYYTGRVDHVWGPESSHAAYRARYWCGSSLADLAKYQGAYGDVLDGVLTGRIAQPAAWKTLRTKRLNAAGLTPLREKALTRALQDVGMTEDPPNSNICPISQWYGITGPWCAMAVTRWYVDAGSTTFKRGERYAYVPFIVNDARAGANNLATTTTPLPGDLVCFDWDADGIADHVGLFKEGSTSEFQTCEGNTSVSSDSNGGSVMIRNRTGSQVQVFVHVGG